MKPGDWTPPPTVPARVENFIPTGVISVNSRWTVMMPLHMGRMHDMHSKQPQEVMGSSIME